MRHLEVPLVKGWVGKGGNLWQKWLLHWGRVIPGFLWFMVALCVCVCLQKEGAACGCDQSHLASWVGVPTARSRLLRGGGVESKPNSGAGPDPEAAAAPVLPKRPCMARAVEGPPLSVHRRARSARLSSRTALFVVETCGGPRTRAAHEPHTSRTRGRQHAPSRKRANCESPRVCSTVLYDLMAGRNAKPMYKLPFPSLPLPKGVQRKTG